MYTETINYIANTHKTNFYKQIVQGFWSLAIKPVGENRELLSFFSRILTTSCSPNVDLFGVYIKTFKQKPFCLPGMSRLHLQWFWIHISIVGYIRLDTVQFGNLQQNCESWQLRYSTHLYTQRYHTHFYTQIWYKITTMLNQATISRPW